MGAQDNFRKVKFGDVDVMVNSKAVDGGRFIDESRLRASAEKLPDKDPRKKGEGVEIPNDVVKNVRFHEGTLKHRSSYQNFNEVVDVKSPAGVGDKGGK